MNRTEIINYMKEKRQELIDFWEDYKHENHEVQYYDFVINSLEVDEAYQLESEKAKVVTTKQLEEMYEKFQKKLWAVREDVRGDDMIEVGFAEQFLQDFLGEFGCWDEGDSE